MIDNDKPKKEKPVMSDEEGFMNRIVYWVAGTLMFVVLSMTTCTMHSNTYDPDRLREEAKIEQVKVELERYKAETIRQTNEISKARLESLEKMVANGVNPIAAGCAIMGFKNDDVGCIVAAAGGNPTVYKQSE